MAFNVIGISAYYHDSACCLISNGKLVSAVEEERFSRKKHDSGTPWRSFKYCMEKGNLSISDIDVVAFYENPVKRVSRKIWMALQDDISIDQKNTVLKSIDVSKIEREIREGIGFEGKIEYVDHHLAHAGSAFHFSDYNDAAIFTIDGVGEWATTTYGKGINGDIEIIEEVEFPDSIGLLYATITSYLGFKINSGEYKVMGLAPYGKPKYADKIYSMIEEGKNGQYSLNMDYFDFLKKERMYSDKMVELFGQEPRVPESSMDTFHKDMAASIQYVTEEILIKKVNYLYSIVPSKNLCMAGGVALNCVANGRIQRESSYEKLFVQPAANDAGAALGAASVIYYKQTGKQIKKNQLNNMLLGPEYDKNDISKIISNNGGENIINDYSGNEDELIKITARELGRGKVIGWYTGPMEFGPRALGARSILADPRRPEMRDKINALVKKREAFRPFAPAAIWEKVPEYFYIDHESPYMLETCQVKDLEMFPAITHVNGSARLQTVHKGRSNERFYKLIKKFNELTGCPILLNTSFNMRGEPIVCTPKDAIKCFIKSNLDMLVLDCYIIKRENVPKNWVEAIIALDEENDNDDRISQKVYAML